MAKYELIQYGCDKCGKLSEVLDGDKGLPQGWVHGDGRRQCYCDECVKKYGISRVLTKTKPRNYDRH